MAGALTTTLMFLGAAGTVTGSKYLVTVGARRILVDAGMFQGEKKWRLKNWEEFPVDPASISDVILTHAHMDHVGYLPALARNGFDGPVWCTPGTRELAEIVMRDAAKLQELEAQDANERGYSKHSPALPLYTTADVEDLLPQFVALEYDTDFELTGDERPGFTPDAGQTVTIRLTRAGHILGSASVNLWTPTATVLFSGDLGRHDHPVLRPRDIPLGAPTVLIESTYGDREHPEPDTLPHEGFADVIRRTIERGGSVVVPAFAIDRTEVVLKTISDLERDGRIPDVPVFVDSPMGVRALRVYQSQPDELRPDLRPEDFLAIPDLTAVESPEDSKRLTAPNGHRPAVIISSSGMATGGRVLHHLETLLPDARNAVVLTGYQGVGTRGGSSPRVPSRSRSTDATCRCAPRCTTTASSRCTPTAPTSWTGSPNCTPARRPCTASTVRPTRPPHSRPVSSANCTSTPWFPGTARWWSWTPEQPPRQRSRRPPPPPSTVSPPRSGRGRGPRVSRLIP
jgi:metallo-beta-lactamase family protein